MVRSYNKSASGTVYYGVFSASVTKTFVGQVKNVKVAKASTGVNVTWSAANGVTGYQIYRKTESESSYTRIATAGASATSYADKTATAKTVYTYMVRAYYTTSAGETLTGVFSASVNVSTK